VPWYLRFGFSYRDVDELLAERGGVYVYRAIDQYAPIIGVYVSARRDTRAA
jgi:transposase-like protein